MSLDTATALAARLLAVADRSEAPADLAAAEQAVRDLLGMLGSDDPVRARTLATLGSILRRQGRLEAAIEVLREAVDTAVGDRALCLANLGNTLLSRRGPGDLDEAVGLFGEALELTSSTEPAYPAYLMNLGLALVQTGEIDRGIAAMDRAVEAARPGDPRLGAYRANLADALRARFRRTFHRADIDRAVTEARAAVEAQPIPAVLAILGGALLSRAESTGDDSDLADAVNLLFQALRATPEGHPMRARRMAGFAAALGRRAEAHGDPKDLEMAEALLLTAIRTAPERAFLVNLSATLIRHTEMTGDEARLDRAIAIAREADRTNLAAALHIRAARTGHLPTLDEALAANGGAPGAAPLHQTRYLLTGRGADLNAAITAAETDAGGTVDADPELPGRLANLGNALRLRGVRTKNAADLDRAVDALRRAAGLARTGRAGHLSNLGAALQSRAELGDGDPADAPPVLREAVDLAGPDSPHRPRYLSNLGNALVNAGQPVAGAALHREALALLPNDHPDRAVIQGNLSAALLATGSAAVLPEAISATRAVSDSPTANGQDRLLATWRLADLEILTSGGDASQGASIMSTAIDLAEREAWVGVTPADRAYTLVRFSGLALDAAAAITASGHPESALAALESGRSIGWRDQLHHRRIDTLATEHPTLAARLRAIAVALDRGAARF